jgi:hypothetical protein
MSQLWIGSRYFDINVGAVISDEVAFQRLSQGDELVVHIGSLLVDEIFPYSRDSFTEQKNLRAQIFETWDQPCYERYGEWILNLVSEIDPNAYSFTRQHIRRMEALGLGPGTEQIMDVLKISRIAEFRKIVGLEPGRTRLQYADWQLNDWIKYSHKLLAIKKASGDNGKLHAEDFNNAYRRGYGPSESHIMRGPAINLDNLNDLNGFPNPASMDDDDIVSLGVRVMRANNGRRITKTLIQILSKRDRMPSVATLQNRFSRLSLFTNKVLEMYELDLAYEDKRRKEKLNKYWSLIHKRWLPGSFRDLTEDELLEIAGRYELVDTCLPYLANGDKVEIAQALTHDVVVLIQDHRPWITRGFVETEAVIRGVFDFVWPIDEGLDFLTITDEEYAEVNDKLVEKERVRLATMKRAGVK